MDKPTSVAIVCQSCKAKSSPRKIVVDIGRCRACQQSTWRIQAEYDAVVERDGDADIGMKMLGAGLLLATGTGFIGNGGGSRKVGKSFAEVDNVDGETVFQLCNPARQALGKIAEFIFHAEKERQRKRMEERGANHCQVCNILFVPSTEKPWTLMGACSRLCCAKTKGVASYSEIEEEVRQGTQSVSEGLEQFKKDNAKVDVTCDCGHQFAVPSMYQGVYRKCPSCSKKVLVPKP